MPEGDTVFAAASRLNAALAGRPLVRTDFRVPAFATSDLSGQVVVEVVSRGKHLLFRTDAGLTLHTHFKMDGRWRLYLPEQRWGGRGHEIRVVLETESVTAVGYRLAIVELLPTRRENEVVGHLGPDPLSADWDPAEAVRRLTASPQRAIGVALLDQTVIAGPGNVWKSEICYLRGVSPWTAVGDVPDLDGLVSLVHRVMQANRTTGGQITTGDTRPGRGRHVYGRGGEPCLRCGTPIRVASQAGDRETYPDERVTYWCPSCQPARGR